MSIFLTEYGLTWWIGDYPAREVTVRGRSDADSSAILTTAGVVSGHGIVIYITGLPGRRQEINMRNSLFIKARRMIEENRVVVAEVTENSIHFSIDGENVIFENRNGLRILPCTCKFSSLKSGKMLFCSHQIAAIAYLTINGSHGSSLQSIPKSHPEPSR